MNTNDTNFNQTSCCHLWFIRPDYFCPLLNELLKAVPAQSQRNWRRQNDSWTCDMSASLVQLMKYGIRQIKSH